MGKKKDKKLKKKDEELKKLRKDNADGKDKEHCKKGKKAGHFPETHSGCGCHGSDVPEHAHGKNGKGHFPETHSGCGCHGSQEHEHGHINTDGKQENNPMMKGSYTRKEEALRLLFEAWEPELQTEEVPLTEARGRVLSEDMFAKYDIPVVRASFMDGVAVKSEMFKDGVPDTSGWTYGNEYVRADTGDDFDDAYDAVIMIEKTDLSDGKIKIDGDVKVKPGMNVKPKGTDIRKGTQVGEKGKKLLAKDLAALAIGGYNSVSVAKKPKIAFIPTGSELVPAGSELQRGQNFDSNSIMVKTMLEGLGAEVLLHPIVKDEKAAVIGAVKEMLPQADFVILNAGSSKGSEDFCTKFLKESGNLLYKWVAAVPGRPMSAAIIDGKPVVNMAGPAFAAYYGCNWFMRPVMAHMTGLKPECPPFTEAVLTTPLGGPPSFSAMTPLRITEGEGGTLLATPIPTRGPGAKESVCALLADAYYVSTPGEGRHEAGDKIRVRLAR